MSDDWKAKYEELVEKHSAVVDKRAKDVDEIISLRGKVRSESERVVAAEKIMTMFTEYCTETERKHDCMIYGCAEARAWLAATARQVEHPQKCPEMVPGAMIPFPPVTGAQNSNTDTRMKAHIDATAYKEPELGRTVCLHLAYYTTDDGGRKCCVCHVPCTHKWADNGSCLYCFASRTAQDTCGNCGISPPCPGLCRLLSKDTTQDNSRWACGCGNVNSTKPRHPQYCSLCGRTQESSNEGEVK